jgi:hypothetical protein
VTSLRAGRFAVRISAGEEINLFSETSKPPLWSPSSFLFKVYLEPFNRWQISQDLRFPFQKSKWIYASAPPICLRDVYKCNLTFCFQVEFSSVLKQLVVYLSCKNTCPLLSLIFLPFDKLYLLLMKAGQWEKSDIVKCWK